MSWHDANQRYLSAALDRVAGLLRLAAGEQGITMDGAEGGDWRRRSMPCARPST